METTCVHWIHIHAQLHMPDTVLSAICHAALRIHCGDSKCNQAGAISIIRLCRISRELSSARQAHKALHSSAQLQTAYPAVVNSSLSFSFTNSPGLGS